MSAEEYRRLVNLLESIEHKDSRFLSESQVLQQLDELDWRKAAAGALAAGALGAGALGLTGNKGTDKVDTKAAYTQQAQDTQAAPEAPVSNQELMNDPLSSDAKLISLKVRGPDGTTDFDTNGMKNSEFRVNDGVLHTTGAFWDGARQVSRKTSGTRDIVEFVKKTANEETRVTRVDDYDKPYSLYTVQTLSSDSPNVTIYVYRATPAPEDSIPVSASKYRRE